MKNPKTVEGMLYELLLELANNEESNTTVGQHFMVNLCERLVALEALTDPLHRYGQPSTSASPPTLNNHNTPKGTNNE